MQTSRFLKLGLATLFFSALILPSAYAEDLEPTDTTWGTFYSDDGFAKAFTIYKYGTEPTYDDFGDSATYSLEIQCESRELSLLIYASPIGIYPDGGLNGIGTAQVRVDSGKVVKYKYVQMKDNSGVAIWSPKLLTSALLKGKKQVAFKIPSSVQSDAVAVFKIGDMSKFTAKFKSLGCPLK